MKVKNMLDIDMCLARKVLEFQTKLNAIENRLVD